jgi:hypothetical protein
MEGKCYRYVRTQKLDGLQSHILPRYKHIITQWASPNASVPPRWDSHQFSFFFSSLRSLLRCSEIARKVFGSHWDEAPWYEYDGVAYEMVLIVW